MLFRSFPVTISAVRNAYGIYRLTMSLTIEAACALTAEWADNPSTKCEEMLADLQALLLPNPKSISPNVRDILYVSGGPTEWPVAEAKTMGARAVFAVIYDVITPYQQPLSNRMLADGGAAAGDSAESEIEV